MATEAGFTSHTVNAFAGDGVQKNEDGTVSMAFHADGQLLDFTMTAEQASTLGARLTAAAK